MPIRYTFWILALLLLTGYPIVVMAQSDKPLVVKGDKTIVITNPESSTINISNVTNVNTKVNYNRLAEEFVKTLTPVLRKIIDARFDSLEQKNRTDAVIDSALNAKPDLKRLFEDQKQFEKATDPLLKDSITAVQTVNPALRDSLLIPVTVANGYSVIRYRNKYGLISVAGEQVLGYKYDMIAFTGDTSCIAVVRNQIGYYITIHETTVLSIPGASLVFPFRNGLARVVVNGKFGVINRNGKVVIPPVYDGLNDFYMGIAPFYRSTKYGGGFSGLLDTTGKIIMPAAYHINTMPDPDGTGNYYELWVKKNKKGLSASTRDGWVILNRSGKILIQAGKKNYAPSCHSNAYGFFTVNVGKNRIGKAEAYLFDSTGNLLRQSTNGERYTFFNDTLLRISKPLEFRKQLGWIFRVKLTTLSGTTFLDNNFNDIRSTPGNFYLVGRAINTTMVYGMINPDGLEMIPLVFSKISLNKNGGYTATLSATLLEQLTGSSTLPASLTSRIVQFDQTLSCQDNCELLHYLVRHSKQPPAH